MPDIKIGTKLHIKGAPSEVIDVYALGSVARCLIRIEGRKSGIDMPVDQVQALLKAQKGYHW